MFVSLGAFHFTMLFCVLGYVRVKYFVCTVSAWVSLL